MEIKNTLLKNLDPYRNRVGQTTGNAPDRTSTPASSNAPQGDRVSLSDGARLHGAAHAEVASAPEVRQEKVDALKERVTDGSYTVDTKTVARKLLETDALLAGTLNE